MSEQEPSFKEAQARFQIALQEMAKAAQDVPVDKHPEVAGIIINAVLDIFNCKALITQELKILKRPQTAESAPIAKD